MSWITDDISGNATPVKGINGAQLVVQCDVHGNPVGAGAGGGGGTGNGAGGVTDLLFVDQNNVLFVWRDTGTTVPQFVAYQLSGAPYQPVGASHPYSNGNVVISSGTVSVNAGIGFANLASENGGNLAAMNGKIPALGSALSVGSVPVALAQDSPLVADFGLKTDARATWHDSVASFLGLIRLFIAVSVDAGSHVYTYNSGVLQSDDWTLFGTTRRKTYVFANGVLTSESDWV